MNTKTMNATTRPAVLAALDITAEEIVNSKNWTGLTLKELFDYGRVVESDVSEWTRLRTDDAIDRAYSRILDHPARKKPYLDWETEARPLYRWAEDMQKEVLALLKNEEYYVVSLKETHFREVVVEAANPEQALKKALDGEGSRKDLVFGETREDGHKVVTLDEFSKS